MERLRDLDKRHVVGCGFILAMVIAPFIALIYGLGFALSVLTIGLLLTAYLAFEARDQVETHRRTTVMLMAGIALAFALLTGLAAFSQFQ